MTPTAELTSQFWQGVAACLGVVVFLNVFVIAFIYSQLQKERFKNVADNAQKTVDAMSSDDLRNKLTQELQGPKS